MKEGKREGKTDPQMIEQKSLPVSYICKNPELEGSQRQALDV